MTVLTPRFAGHFLTKAVDGRVVRILKNRLERPVAQSSPGNSNKAMPLSLMLDRAAAIIDPLATEGLSRIHRLYR
jgi:hypothetical protein